MSGKSNIAQVKRYLGIKRTEHILLVVYKKYGYDAPARANAIAYVLQQMGA